MLLAAAVTDYSRTFVPVFVRSLGWTSSGHVLSECFLFVVSAYRYIAITTLAIIAVFLVYLRQFLIDLHQIYRRSSVPKNTSP